MASNALNFIQFSVPVNTLTGVTAAAATNLITKTAHGLSTGDVFVPIFGSGYGGLTSTSRYYAIVISSSTFKAASSLANAVAGTEIDITTDGGSATFLVATPLIATAGVAIYNGTLLPNFARVYGFLITPSAGALGTITLGVLNSAGRADPKSPVNSLQPFATVVGTDLDKLYFIGTDTTDAVDVLAQQ